MQGTVRKIIDRAFCITAYFVIILTFTACIRDTSDSGTESGEESPVNAHTTDTTLYTEPPVMSVCYGDQAVSISPGSYEWNYHVSGDTWSGVVSDAPHPLDQNYTDRILYLDPAQSVHEFTVNFDITPTSVEILTYWPTPADAPAHQSLPAPKEEIDYNSGIRYGHTADLLSPNAFLAFNGSYIYEIHASFETDTYYGDAYYSILIKDASDVITDQ